MALCGCPQPMPHPCAKTRGGFSEQFSLLCSCGAEIAGSPSCPPANLATDSVPGSSHTGFLATCSIFQAGILLAEYPSNPSPLHHTCSLHKVHPSAALWIPLLPLECKTSRHPDPHPGGAPGGMHLPSLPLAKTSCLPSRCSLAPSGICLLFS